MRVSITFSNETRLLGNRNSYFIFLSTVSIILFEQEMFT
ncbi:hypothetical protein LEP1GSC037_5640 [Leptospira interrogans str. 2006001854]|uniref:Uncharacterized protein n=1 Tax=Leptospira interrogans str. 2006001854 TaxID=1001590 RepID=M6GR65_LEPIR|nr:hypothetical protein LEP1GSC037_5640 [Leptospira interrogans str. 2006001854]